MEYARLATAENAFQNKNMTIRKMSDNASFCGFLF